MLEDLKAASRSLRASRTFTVVALTVLALGIGASTAIFSVVDAVVLRGLPFDEHDRLVAVGERRLPRPNAPRPTQPVDPAAVSSSAPQNYMDWAAQQQVFESMAAIAGGALTLREPGAEPEEIRSQRVTAGFFDVLRERPVLGQPFTAENETQGNHQVAVLSDGLWRRRFDADPAIVGKTIPLEGGAYRVVGIMAPDFAYPVGAVRPTELWVPYVVPADEVVRHPNNVSVYLQTIARLKPGVSLEQAQANFDQIAAALKAAHPKWNEFTWAGVRPLRDPLVGARTRQWMLMLLGAVGIVLLIACANVANLLLARASSREREVGIRAALGAGRWRLIRGLLVESLLLSTVGTILALFLAWWGVNILRASMPDGVARLSSIAVDMRVLGVTALVSLVTGILFGIVPALQLSRPNLATALKEGARGSSAGRAQQWLRHALVVVEVALAVVLLVGAALFIGSFRTLMKIDPGFNPSNVLTTAIQPRVDRSVAGAEFPDFAPQFNDIVERLSQAPGVRHVAVISGGTPMTGSMSSTSITVPGKELAQDQRSVSIRQVSSQYHKVLGIPLLEGREFTPADRAGSQDVAILTKAAATKLFPGESAVGKTVGVRGTRIVVGVVGTVYQNSLESEPLMEVYVPLTQGRVTYADIVVRTAGAPLDVVPAVKAAVLAVLPDVPLRNVRTMEELLGRQVAQRRLNMLLLGLFGVLGLVISAVGIYGVMAYLVAQRTREIGVRMALGASRWAVVYMVLVRSAILVTLGLAIGGVASWFISGTAETFLFRIQTTDWRVFATALGLIMFAALLASAVPARRAASVNPVEALRAD
jgi:putative ABC transport system permease protein